VKRSSVISANKYRSDLIKKPDFALKLAATQFKNIDDSRPYITDDDTIREQSIENNDKANHRSLLAGNN
jgi:NADH-quinone oxidoreductase subunit G